ncbi:hypothetical protein IEQ34_026814 [Dendrobium chrysotoxum]|uniref:Uncharacterized protein n=1 Tax=Dendrobium chrysotoxum TaxID=161865 RepID=A0AAV7FKX5_DENCH|nr:hypothetical protein IEQ34_026814 [Dendrobium chrysotoxum]
MYSAEAANMSSDEFSRSSDWIRRRTLRDVFGRSSEHIFGRIRQKQRLDSTENRTLRDVMPNAKKFCYNGIPREFEEKLDLMFSRIVATGENVWIPNSGVLLLELNNDHTISSEEEYTQDEQTHHPHIPTKNSTGNYDS